MDHITLRQLQAVAAVRAEGRVAAAARRLGLTPPAVTLQLRQIEAAVGLVLFDRTAGGMRPTPAGIAVADAAEAVIARLDALAAETRALAGGRAGRVVVGVVSTSERLGRQLAAAFAATAPEIAIEIRPGDHAATVERLRAYEIDVMLSGRPPRDLSVRAEPFAEYRFVVAAAPDHPLAGRSAIPRAALAQEQILARAPGTGPRLALDHFLGARGAARTLTELPSNDAIARAAADGLGIAFAARHTLARALDEGILLVLDVEATPVRRQWFFITRSDRTLTPAVARFLDFLRLHGAETAEGDE